MIAKMEASGQQIPKEIAFPAPRSTREEQQEAYLREIEVDPAKYYPKDVDRDLITSMPPIKINVAELIKNMKSKK